MPAASRSTGPAKRGPSPAKLRKLPRDKLPEFVAWLRLFRGRSIYIGKIWFFGYAQVQIHMRLFVFYGLSYYRYSNMNKKIYLDYAATTPMDPRVLEAVGLVLKDKKKNFV